VSSEEAHAEAQSNWHIEGPSFPPLLKILACSLVTALFAMALPLIAAGSLRQIGSAAWLAIGVAVAVVLTNLWNILTGRTRITPESIEQTGWRTQRVALAEVTRVKLILLPGLTWLVVPRIVLRTRSPGTWSFSGATPDLAAAFARISLGMNPGPDTSHSGSTALRSTVEPKD
jgi:hypothetical protein